MYIYIYIRCIPNALVISIDYDCHRSVDIISADTNKLLFELKTTFRNRESTYHHHIPIKLIPVRTSPYHVITLSWFIRGD